MLTADHVPPKGAGALGEAELKTLCSYLSADSERPKIYQNGVKFPTLCADCNNTRLGGRYDPALIALANDMSALVRVAQRKLISLPAPMKIRTKPQRVARGVVGHLLAVRSHSEAGRALVHAPFPDAMREYFLDESARLPSEIAIYYWVYPSSLHVVGRGFGVNFSFPASRWIVGDMIKWFPLGYWITWDEPRGIRIPLPKLIDESPPQIDEEVDLEVPLRNIPPVRWPEHPGAWGARLLSDENTFVAYRRRRSRRS